MVYSLIGYGDHVTLVKSISNNLVDVPIQMIYSGVFVFVNPESFQ